MFDIPFIVFFALILIFSLGEFLLSSTWTPLFFRVGIPLYRQEFRLISSISSLEPYIGALEGQLPRQGQRPSIAFKALSSNELAFRQKFGQRNSSYGKLEYDLRRQLLTLTGYLPWSVLVIPVFFIFIVFWGAFAFHVMFLFIFLLIMGFSIFAQRKNYGRIAEAIQQTFQQQITHEDIAVMPEIQSYDSYDPFTTTNSGTDFSLNRILLIVLLIVLALSGLVLSYFFIYSQIG